MEKRWKKWSAVLAIIGMLCNWYLEPALAGWSYSFEADKPALPNRDDLETYFREADEEKDKEKGLSLLRNRLGLIKMEWERKAIELIEKELRKLGEDNALSLLEIEQAKLFLEDLEEEALSDVALWERKALEEWERGWEVREKSDGVSKEVKFEAVEVKVESPGVEEGSLRAKVGEVDSFNDVGELERAISEANAKVLEGYERDLKDGVSEAKARWLGDNPDATEEEVGRWEKEADEKMKVALSAASKALALEGEGIKEAFRRRVEGEIAKGEESWEEVFGSFKTARANWEDGMASLRASGERQWEEARATLAELRRAWEEKIEETKAGGEGLWSEAERRLEGEREEWESEFEKRKSGGLARWSQLEEEMMANRGLAEVELARSLSEERARWEGYLGELKGVMLTEAELDFGELARGYELLAEEYGERQEARSKGQEARSKGQEARSKRQETLEEVYSGDAYSDEEYKALSEKYSELASRMRGYADKAELLQEGAIKELGYYIATDKAGSTREIDERVKAGLMPLEYTGVMEALRAYREEVGLVEEAERDSERKEKAYKATRLEKEGARVSYEASERHYVDVLDQFEEAFRIYVETESALRGAESQLGEAQKRYDELSALYKDALTAYNEAIDDQNFAQANYHNELLVLTEAQREYNKALEEKVVRSEEYRKVLEGYGDVLGELNPLQDAYNGTLDGYNNLLSVENARHGEYNDALVEYLAALSAENDEHTKYNTELGEYVRALGDENAAHEAYNRVLEEYNTALKAEGDRHKEYADALNAYTDALGVYRKWGSRGNGDGQFSGVTGIAVDSSGNVYAVDSNIPRVQKFDSSGNIIGSYNIPIDTAYDIAMDSSGNIYVAGRDFYSVFKLNDSRASLVRKLYSGNILGDIAVDGSDNVYITDNNRRVMKFDGSGKLITTWVIKGQTGSMAVDKQGNVYVPDPVLHRIYKYDGSGNLITSWGRIGRGEGQFIYPRSVTVDDAGNVYVADVQNNRIQKFDSSGNFIAKWGGYGSGDGQFNFPFDIAVDGSGNVYVTDQGNSRIQKFDGNLFEKEAAADVAENITYPQWATEAKEAVEKLGLLEEAYTNWQGNIQDTIAEKEEMEGAYSAWQGRVRENGDELEKVEAAYSIWQALAGGVKDKEYQKESAYLEWMEGALTAEEGFESALKESDPDTTAYRGALDRFEEILNEYRSMFNGSSGNDYVSMIQDYYDTLDSYNGALATEKELREAYYAALGSYNSALDGAKRTEASLKEAYQIAWGEYEGAVASEMDARAIYTSALDAYIGSPTVGNKTALEAAYGSWQPLAQEVEEKRRALTGYYDGDEFKEGAYQKWLGAKGAIEGVSKEGLENAYRAWEEARATTEGLKAELDGKYSEWESAAEALEGKKEELEGWHWEVEYLREEILSGKEGIWEEAKALVEEGLEEREVAFERAVVAYNILEMTKSVVGERDEVIKTLQPLLSGAEELVVEAEGNYALALRAKEEAGEVYQRMLTERDNALSDAEAKKKAYEEAEASYSQATSELASAQAAYDKTLGEKESAHRAYRSAVESLRTEAIDAWDANRERFVVEKRTTWDEQEKRFRSNKAKWVEMIEGNKGEGLKRWDRMEEELNGRKEEWEREFRALVDGKLAELAEAEDAFAERRASWEEGVLVLEGQLRGEWEKREVELRSRRDEWSWEMAREVRASEARLSGKIREEMNSFQKEAERASQEEVGKVKAVLQDEIARQIAAKAAELRAGWDVKKAEELRDLEYGWEQSWRTLQDIQKASEAYVKFNFSQEEVRALSGGAGGVGGVIAEWNDLKGLLEGASVGLRGDLMKMAKEELEYLEGIEGELKKYGYVGTNGVLGGAEKIKDTKSLMSFVEGVIEGKRDRIKEFLVSQIGMWWDRERGGSRGEGERGSGEAEEIDIEEGVREFLARAELLKQAEGVLREKGYRLPGGSLLAREEALWLIQSELELSEIEGIVKGIERNNKGLAKENKGLAERIEVALQKMGVGSVGGSNAGVDKIREIMEVLKSGNKEELAELVKDGGIIEEIDGIKELLAKDSGSTAELAGLVALEERLKEESREVEEQISYREMGVEVLEKEQEELNSETEELEEEESQLVEEKKELGKKTLALESRWKVLEREKGRAGDETRRLEREKEGLEKERERLDEWGKALEREKEMIETEVLLIAGRMKESEEALERWYQEQRDSQEEIDRGVELREIASKLLGERLEGIKGIEKMLEGYGYRGEWEKGGVGEGGSRGEVGIELLEGVITDRSLTAEERKGKILEEIDRLVAERLEGVEGYLVGKGYSVGSRQLAEGGGELRTDEPRTNLEGWEKEIREGVIDFVARMKVVEDELYDYGLGLDDKSLDKFKDVNEYLIRVGGYSEQVALEALEANAHGLVRRVDGLERMLGEYGGYEVSGEKVSSAQVSGANRIGDVKGFLRRLGGYKDGEMENLVEIEGVAGEFIGRVEAVEEGLWEHAGYEVEGVGGKKQEAGYKKNRLMEAADSLESYGDEYKGVETLGELEEKFRDFAARVEKVEDELGVYIGYKDVEADKFGVMVSIMEAVGGGLYDEIGKVGELERRVSDLGGKIETLEEGMKVYAGYEEVGFDKYWGLRKHLWERYGGIEDTIGGLKRAYDDFVSKVGGLEEELQVYAGYGEVTFDKYGAVRRHLEERNGRRGEGESGGIGVLIGDVIAAKDDFATKVEGIEDDLRVYAGYNEVGFDKYGALRNHLEARYGGVGVLIGDVLKAKNDFASKVEGLEDDLRVYAGYSEVGIDKYGAVKRHLEARYGAIGGVLKDVVKAKGDFVSKVERLEDDLKVYAGYSEVGFDKYGAVRGHLQARYGVVGELIGDVIKARNDFALKVEKLEGDLKTYAGYKEVVVDKYGSVKAHLEARYGGVGELAGDVIAAKDDFVSKVEKLEDDLRIYAGYSEAGIDKYGAVKGHLEAKYGSVGGLIGDVVKAKEDFIERVDEVEDQLGVYVGYGKVGENKFRATRSKLEDVGGGMYGGIVRIDQMEDMVANLIGRVGELEKGMKVYAGYGGVGFDKYGDLRKHLGGKYGSIADNIVGLESAYNDFVNKVEVLEEELKVYAGYSEVGFDKYGALRNHLGSRYGDVGVLVDDVIEAKDDFASKVENLEEDLRVYAGYREVGFDKYGAVKGHLGVRYGVVGMLVGDVIAAKDDFVWRVDRTEDQLGVYAGYEEVGEDKFGALRGKMEEVGGMVYGGIGRIDQMEVKVSDLVDRIETLEEGMKVYAGYGEVGFNKYGELRRHLGERYGSIEEVGSGDAATIVGLESAYSDFADKVEVLEEYLKVYAGYSEVAFDKYGAVRNHLESRYGSVGVLVGDVIGAKDDFVSKVEEFEDDLRVYAGYNEVGFDKYGAVKGHLVVRYGGVGEWVNDVIAAKDDFVSKVEELEDDLRVYAGYNEVGFDKYSVVKGHLEARYGSVGELIGDVADAKDDFVSKVDDLEDDLRVYAGYNEVGFDKYSTVKGHLEARYGSVGGLISDVVGAKDDFVGRVDGVEAQLGEYLGYDGSKVGEDKFGKAIDRLESVGGGEYDGLVLIGEVEDVVGDLADRVDNIEGVLGEYGGYEKVGRNKFGGVEGFLRSRVEGYGSVGEIGLLEKKVLVGYEGSFAQRVRDIESKLREYGGYEFTSDKANRFSGINDFLKDSGGYEKVWMLGKLERSSITVDRGDSDISFVEWVDGLEDTLETYGGYGYNIIRYVFDPVGGNRIAQINGFLTWIGGYGVKGDLSGVEGNVNDFKAKVEGFERELSEYAGYENPKSQIPKGRYGELRGKLSELGYAEGRTDTVSEMRGVVDEFKGEVVTLEGELKEYAGHMTAAKNRFGALRDTLGRVGCGCLLSLETVSKVKGAVGEMKNRVIAVEGTMGRYAGYEVGVDRVDRLGRVDGFLGRVWGTGYVKDGTIGKLEENLIKFTNEVESVEGNLKEYVGHEVNVDSTDRLGDVKTTLEKMGGYSASEMAALEGAKVKSDDLVRRVEALEGELTKYAGYMEKDYSGVAYDGRNNRSMDAAKFILSVAGYSAGNVSGLEARKNEMTGRIGVVEGKLDDYGYDKAGKSEEQSVLEYIIDKFLMEELGYGIAGLVQQAKGAGLLLDVTDVGQRAGLMDVLAGLKEEAKGKGGNDGPSNGTGAASSDSGGDSTVIYEQGKSQVENGDSGDDKDVVDQGDDNPSGVGGSSPTGSNNQPGDGGNPPTDKGGSPSNVNGSLTGGSSSPSKSAGTKVEPSPEELERRRRQSLKNQVPIYRSLVSGVDGSVKPEDTLSGVEDVTDDFDRMMVRAEAFLSKYGYVVNSSSKDRVEDIRSFLVKLGYDEYDMIYGMDVIDAVNDFGVRITKLQKELIDKGFVFRADSTNYLSDIEGFVGGKVIITKPDGVSNESIRAMIYGDAIKVVNLPIYNSSMKIEGMLDGFYEEFKAEMKDKLVGSVTKAVNDEVGEDYRWRGGENGWYRSYYTKPDWFWEKAEKVEQRIRLEDYKGDKDSLVLTTGEIYDVLASDNPDIDPSIRGMVGEMKGEYGVYADGEVNRIEGVVEEQENKRTEDQSNIWDDLWNGIVGFFGGLFGIETELKVEVEIKEKVRAEVAKALEYYDSDKRVVSDNKYRFELGDAEEKMKGYGYEPLSGNVSKGARWKGLQRYMKGLGYEEGYGLSDVDKALYAQGNGVLLAKSVKAAVGDYDYKVTNMEEMLEPYGYSVDKGPARIANVANFVKSYGYELPSSDLGTLSNFTYRLIADHRASGYLELSITNGNILLNADNITYKSKIEYNPDGTMKSVSLQEGTTWAEASNVDRHFGPGRVQNALLRAGVDDLQTAAALTGLMLVETNLTDNPKTDADPSDGSKGAGIAQVTRGVVIDRIAEVLSKGGNLINLPEDIKDKIEKARQGIESNSNFESYQQAVIEVLKNSKDFYYKNNDSLNAEIAKLQYKFLLDQFGGDERMATLGYRMGLESVKNLINAKGGKYDDVVSYLANQVKDSGNEIFKVSKLVYNLTEVGAYLAGAIMGRDRFKTLMTLIAEQQAKKPDDDPTKPPTGPPGKEYSTPVVMYADGTGNLPDPNDPTCAACGQVAASGSQILPDPNSSVCAACGYAALPEDTTVSSSSSMDVVQSVVSEETKSDESDKVSNDNRTYP